MALFGRLLKGGTDFLVGYIPSAIEISDEAFLTKGEQKNQLTAIPSGNQNDRMEGTVFEISQEELLIADKYEPDGFSRIEVELASGKKAWIYVSNTT